MSGRGVAHRRSAVDTYGHRSVPLQSARLNSRVVTVVGGVTGPGRWGENVGVVDHAAHDDLVAVRGDAQCVDIIVKRQAYDLMALQIPGCDELPFELATEDDREVSSSPLAGHVGMGSATGVW